MIIQPFYKNLLTYFKCLTIALRTLINIFLIYTIRRIICGKKFYT